jgi:hypothetical protein
VTPLGEVRRYDTRFFVAALPAGAHARDVTTESSTASWVLIAQALDEAERGERGMLPPTTSTLAALLPFETVADAIASAAQRDLEPVRPSLLPGDDGSVAVELPDGRVVPIPRSMVP